LSLPPWWLLPAREGSEDRPLIAADVRAVFCLRYGLNDNFRSWLVSQDKTKATVKNTVNYAKKYGYILDTGDASPLLTLSNRSKHHAMSALANYAKYTGRYDQFLQLRQRYNLKWSKGSSLQYFERFFHNKELSFEAMLSKLKKMIGILPLYGPNNQVWHTYRPSFI
jgi:hypothetical protein